MVVAALAIPASGAAAVGFATPATAGPTVTTTCTSLKGTLTGNVTVSKCKGGTTGGATKPTLGTTLATGGTIIWKDGNTTTIAAPTLTSVSAKKCAGYKVGGTVAALSVSATVTAQTGVGDSPIPGTAKGTVCENSPKAGDVSLPKGGKFTIN